MNDQVNKHDVTSATDYDDLTVNQEPDFLALEERIMFDGAMGAEAVDAAVDQVDDDTSSPAPEPDLEAAAATVSAPASDRSEIYVVDAGVDNPDELISAIPDGAEVVVLDGNSDGLAQIASALDGRSDLDAIHILSHGDVGEITLGNTTLDAASIDGHHADDLAAIGDALSDDADILIYGCDFGQDEATLTALAEATGADVAASDDDTGHADLGGDWDLEVTHGEIEAEVLEAVEWRSTLDPVAEHDRFSGLVDYAATGGSLRAEPNSVDSTAVNPTSEGELILPAGITGSDVVGAYLYWAGSGETIDEQVSLNGQTVNAEETHTAEYDSSERYFAGRADVTSIIQADGAGVYTFGDLTVDTGGSFAQYSTVMAGWSMTVVYDDSSLTANQSVVLLDGLELLLDDGTRPASTTVDIQGLQITSDSGRLTTTVHEGDPDPNTSTAEAVQINNTTVGGTGIWDGVSNAPGVGNGSPAYGLDIETIDLSGLVSAGDTSVELVISTGSNDQVLITNTVLTFESNFPPVGVNDTISVTEDTPTTQNVLANDTDNEGDTLTISTVTDATIDTNGDGTADPLTLGTPTALTDSSGNPIGTITVAMNGNVTFDPAPDYNGPIPDLTYTPNDGTIDGSPATVSFGTITPVDDIVDDSATTAEDTPVNTDVLANDGFDNPAAAVTAVTQGANGTVTIEADGTVTYTPDADFNGTDSYTYTVTSGGVTETATVDVTVDPVADGVADDFTTAEDTPLSDDVSANDTHDAAASYALNTDATNGTVSMNPDGTFTYTPNDDYNGPDSFTYDVTDVNGDTETVTVDLTVTPETDIADDSATTDEDTPVNTDVLANDGFDDPAAAVTAVTQGANGTVTIEADGTVTYTPDADFNGTDSYTYTVTSGGVTETATVDVTVDPVGEKTTATPSSSGEISERDDPPRPRMYADPIVDLAAGDQGNLFSTPALMSDINTGLGVEHPIMTALGAIQSLGTTTNLPVEGTNGVETLEAPGAVSRAVNDLGFNPIFSGHSFAIEEFEARLQQVLEQQPDEFADLTTARGDVLYFAAEPLGGDVMVLAFAKTATGQPLPIEAITVADSHAVSSTLNNA